MDRYHTTTVYAGSSVLVTSSRLQLVTLSYTNLDKMTKRERRKTKTNNFDSLDFE